MKLEHKFVPLREFKLLTDGAGGFEGYASKFGAKDDGNDIVVKGAYADTIPQFIENGFHPVGHDWDSLPVGYITEAFEDDTGLFIRGQYHSTQAAQDARTVAMERMAAGKSVGLSIGYQVNENGAEVTPTARLLKSLTLFEVSLVNVPMLRSAGLTAVKAKEREEKQAASGSYEALIEQLSAAFMERTESPFTDRWSYLIATFPDAFIACMHTYDGDEPTTYWWVSYTQNADGSVTLGEPEQMEQTYTPVSDTEKGLTYADHVGRVLAHVRTVTERGKSLADLRRKEGRAISTARRNQLGALRDQLRTGADDLDGLLTETAPPEKGTPVETLRLRSEFDRMAARIARDFGEVA